ncbi:DUF1648 domain-containing protein [uncultured Proteiniphilum sp.]|uniref:DUF1648 domain-containing protein n=1 Tax=uncultured Proteiniphilum sp. TaxID=497637 RepID=UPI002609ABAB|nr:DUF1648 domain-containing protein [uncultured Proteiniphilum sp.]
MKDRPKVKINLTTTDKIIEIIGWTAVVGIWVLTLMNYEKLPEQIPIHYNGAGEADGFGDRSHILTLPIVSTLFFIGLTILNKYPRIFNYFTPITEENAFRQYSNATRMIRLLKLLFVVVFGLIVFRTIQHVNETVDGLGVWFLPLTIGLFFIPVAYYLINSIRQ